MTDGVCAGVGLALGVGVAVGVANGEVVVGVGVGVDVGGGLGVGVGVEVGVGATVGVAVAVAVGAGSVKWLIVQPRTWQPSRMRSSEEDVIRVPALNDSVPDVWIPTIHPKKSSDEFAENTADPLCPPAVSMRYVRFSAKTSRKAGSDPNHIVPIGLSPGYPAIAGVKSDASSVEDWAFTMARYPTMFPGS